MDPLSRQRNDQLTITASRNIKNQMRLFQTWALRVLLFLLSVYLAGRHLMLILQQHVTIRIEVTVRDSMRVSMASQSAHGDEREVRMRGLMASQSAYGDERGENSDCFVERIVDDVPTNVIVNTDETPSPRCGEMITRPISHVHQKYRGQDLYLPLLTHLEVKMFRMPQTHYCIVMASLSLHMRHGGALPLIAGTAACRATRGRHEFGLRWLIPLLLTVMRMFVAKSLQSHRQQELLWLRSAVILAMRRASATSITTLPWLWRAT